MLRCLLRLESIRFDGSLVWSEHLILSLICIYLCYPRRMHGREKCEKDQRITEGNDKSSPRWYPAYLKLFIVLFSKAVVFFFILTAPFDSPFRLLQPHLVAHFISIRFNSLSVSSKPVIWFVCLFWFRTISESKLGLDYPLATADEMLLLFCILCSKSMPWISSMYNVHCTV